MKSDGLLLMGKLGATQLWGRSGIKSLILDMRDLRCLLVRHSRGGKVGSWRDWRLEFKGALRGGDMDLEINHIWMEFQVLVLEENARVESIERVVLSREDGAHYSARGKRRTSKGKVSQQE